MTIDIYCEHSDCEETYAEILCATHLREKVIEILEDLKLYKTPEPPKEKKMTAKERKENTRLMNKFVKQKMKEIQAKFVGEKLMEFLAEKKKKKEKKK